MRARSLALSHVAAKGVALLGLALLTHCGTSPNGGAPRGNDAGAVDSSRPVMTSDAAADSRPAIDSSRADAKTSPDAGEPHTSPASFDPSLLGPQGLKPVIGCEAAAGSACYYASPSGSGTSCSEGSPCPVKTALPLLKGGDYLYLLGGTYTASGLGGTDQIYIDKYFSFAAPPSASARITLKGMPGQTVTMHGNQTEDCAFVDGQSYLTIEGIVFENCGVSGVHVGYDAPAATSDVVVTNNEFHDIYASDNMGAAYIDSVSGATFTNNVVHDFHYTRAAQDALGLIAFTAKDLTIQNNELYSLDQGFYYKHGEVSSGLGGFTHIYANYFHDMTAHALGINQNRTELSRNIFVNTTDVYTFQSDGTVGDFVFGVVFSNNTFATSPLSLNGPTDGFSGSKQTTVDHNVFVDSPYHVWTYGPDSAFDAGIGLVTNDNCFYDSKNALVFDYFSSSNPAYGPDTMRGGLYTFAQWNGLGFDAASIVANPALNTTGHSGAHSPCAAYGAFAP